MKINPLCYFGKYYLKSIFRNLQCIYGENEILFIV